MMGKKIVAFLALAAFCLFDMSCFRSSSSFPIKKTVKLDSATVDKSNTKLRIVNVITKTGECFEFSKNDPARIQPTGDAVTGMAIRDLDIDRKDIKTISKTLLGKIKRIETSDGRKYSVISSTKYADMIHFKVYDAITIPFSDIQQVWIIKTNVGLSIVLAIVGVAGGVALAYLLWYEMFIAPLKKMESCPFVYSFDGEEYVLDAEPYGAAVTEGLKRTDWVELSALREVDGKYRILLTNELDETQYTDELKLVAVDHAPGVSVAPDLMGRVHTFSEPVAPVSAVDQTGRDIMAFVGKNDRVFWLSDLEAKDPEADGEFRDELTFEFPKPAEAMRAKLLANAWTTTWGSHSAGKYMELFGTSLDETYGEVDRHGPMYGRILNWMATEELYNLKVWVETPSGWKARAMIMGGAPVITKDKAYVLDVSDVPGDTLRIKLRPPVNFWMVNSLAVDYGEDSPVQITEIAAESAIDHTGRDVRTELAATDGLYLESPNPGERTELVFAAPPLTRGLVRIVLVKASGYYKIHLDASGEPQTELIARVLGEPGFAARHSFREYQKWAAALLAEVEKAKR